MRLKLILILGGSAKTKNSTVAHGLEEIVAARNLKEFNCLIEKT